MRNILVVGPSWVGDMIMAQSLFKLLKQKEVHSSIDVLAPTWTFPLLSCMPEVNQAIELPIQHRELKLMTRYRLAKQLVPRDYDQAIVLPNSFKSALIPWVARIPQRTGWRGEYRYQLLNDMRYLNKQRYPLMIEQFMALGVLADAPLQTPYPYPQLTVTIDNQRATLEKYQLLQQQEQRPILALCAGAEFGPSKRWPAEYFATVANEKLAAGWQVWLFGSIRDRATTDIIMRLTKEACKNFAGLIDLVDTIHLLSSVTGVVTNDSGLMHMAAALNKPLVALYGSSSSDFTPPLAPSAITMSLNLPCQPCFERTCPLKHHHCMRELIPNRVLDAISTWQ